MKWIYTDNSGLRRRGTLVRKRGNWYYFRREDGNTIDVIPATLVEEKNAHELEEKSDV